MFKSSRDDDQIFVVFMGSRNGTADASSEFANAFLGVLAVAIVLIVFVGLLNDSERRRSRQWSSPLAMETQPGRASYQLLRPYPTNTVMERQPLPRAYYSRY
jgi:hypothetical protein